MIVRPETPVDLPPVREVVAAAFGDEPIAPLLDDLRGSSAWRDLSFVAEREGRVVGHVCFTRGWLDAPQRLFEVLVLSPLSVHPAAQGTGVGQALVRRSLELLVDRPEPLVFLEGSPAYYSRVGFRPGGSLGFSAPSQRIPPAAFQVVVLPTYDDSMTGALVYPDVFWEHDAVGLRESTTP
ncbi:MAG TPA: N-acetyltransferase [Nocardioidaceae bacterium]|nr:N-acetyltransferase [Nocardioidaceae bacterium]